MAEPTDDNVNHEEIERALTRFIVQSKTGQQVLWDALASVLIAKGIFHPIDLAVQISATSTTIPQESDGAICRGITSSAMRALAREESRLSGDPIPEWVEKMISGEKPAKVKEVPYGRI